MRSSHSGVLLNCRKQWPALLLKVGILFLTIFVRTGESIKRDATLNKTTTVIDTNDLDCRMRTLALDFAENIVDSGRSNNAYNKALSLDVLQAVHDALELSRICKSSSLEARSGIRTKNAASSVREQSTRNTANLRHPNGETTSFKEQNKINDADYLNGDISGSHATLAELCNDGIACVFVSTAQISAKSGTVEDSGQEDGSIHHPWTNIHQALNQARSLRKGEAKDQPIMLLLRHGVHYLKGKPLRLSGKDKNLIVRGYPGEEAWISGGISLKNAAFEKDTQHDGIYVADLTDLLKGHKVPITPSLFTSTRRYTRARHPNADPEIDRGGKHFISSDKVLEWTKPPPGNPPNFTFFDFAKDPPDGVPVKNDSTMEGYNQYASGHGGACSAIWGDVADSYWCSNASAGGWGDVDKECAVSGQMQLPVGMLYNSSDEALGPLKSSLEGGYIFAWHSQSWAMHMFEITSHSPVNGTMGFARGGGKQGGRNWCRCDQCTYAGRWCGQHQNPPRNDDQRLIGGDWMIENVREFLDQPGEYFFDKSTSYLYVKPNSTEDLRDLTIGMMTELIDLRNGDSLRIENLSFRDQAATFMEDGWSAPSGGDWSLRRGGAIFIENASNVTISGCHFFRLDGNAVFLSRKTRHIHIKDNLFEWLGESAIATWGDTDGYDATSGAFPMYTLIEHNVMRELAIFEKQSSAVGQSKAALTTIRNNIMFNMARAAINFNDMVGGGDVVEGNLIFNTCRESGDHGPINSWDRQAYLTKLKDGSTASFDPIPRIIRRNFIIANYGASQGVDNDDGSSWFHIHHNLFYQADGFKMDYGGHDSIYEYNMAMSFSYNGGPCFGMGSFKEGHGDILRGNRCLLGLGDLKDSATEVSTFDYIWLKASREERGYSSVDDDEPAYVGRIWGDCKESHITLESNEYYTPDGVARVGCNGDEFFELKDIQTKFGLEVNSTVGLLPDVDTILSWARSIVMTTEVKTAYRDEAPLHIISSNGSSSLS